jgi:hypothetical protein
MGRCVLHFFFFFFIKTKGIIDFFPGGNFKSFTLFNSCSFFILFSAGKLRIYAKSLYTNYKTSTLPGDALFHSKFFFFFFLMVSKQTRSLRN